MQISRSTPMTTPERTAQVQARPQAAQAAETAPTPHTGPGARGKDIVELSRKMPAPAYTDDFIGRRQQQRVAAQAATQASTQATQSATSATNTPAKEPTATGKTQTAQPDRAEAARNFVDRRQAERAEAQASRAQSAQERADRVGQTQAASQQQVQRMMQNGLFG